MKNANNNKGSSSKLINGKHGGAPEVKKDRKSNSGMVGSPKKGGHGGKFTWSGEGYSHAELGSVEKEAVDVNDPNFEDPEPIAQ